MNKYLLIGIITIILVGIGFFALTKQNSQPSPSVITEITEQKITLIGTVKLLNNSDPAQYSYELTLNSPFYDKLKSTGNSYVSKMPILSRDKVLQDSIKGYVGKEVAAEGLMAWGLAESRYLEVSRISDMSSWKTYTNKTYSYSIKFPKNYEVQLGNEEQNTCIRPNVGSPCKVFINTYPNKDNLSLKDYLSKQSIAFLIDGPLIPYNFNGYDSIFNKNQLGTNLFTKRDLTVFHFVASEASSDKEIGDIVATFKFANDSISTNYISAMSILQNLPEIRLLQNDIKRLGRTTFFKAGEENGDVVKIWFYEDGFPDNHTTRIDTFNVNIRTKVITVDDVATTSGQETITLNEWKKTVKGRFQ